MTYRHQLIDDETGKVVLEVSIKDEIGDLSPMGVYVLACEMFASRLFDDGVNAFRACVIDGAEKDKKAGAA